MTKVVVSSPINKTGVYHTMECTNCEMIDKRRELTKEKAERVGLIECVHCAKSYDQKSTQETDYQRVVRDANTLEELKENVNASSIGE